MLELFKSEFLRYRKWSFVAMGVFLAAFAFVARIKPFLQPEATQMALSFLIMVGGSLIFGLMQMFLHKRPNHWTYLVHRPVPPHQILLALLAAGGAVITIAVVIPWFVMTAGIDLFTNDIVDIRHYVFILFFLLSCLVGYLIGTLAVLNASKGILLLVVLMLLLLSPDPVTNFWQFFPATAIIASLLYLNFVSFKPDLSKHTSNPLAIALLAVPMSGVLVYGLILSTGIFYHIPLFVMGVHPDNNPVEDSFGYMWNFEEKERPGYVLANSQHPKAALFAKQAELADVEWINTYAWIFGRQGQLPMKDGQYALKHKESNTIWQFSHDHMLLEGRHGISKKPVGVIGKNGFLAALVDATDADRFDAIPFLVGDKFIQTKKTLYQVNFDERLLDIKFQPAEGTTILGPPQFRENFVALATSKNTLIFDKHEFLDEYEVAVPEYSVPHPVAPENILNILTYRMVDGYILMYMGRHYLGFHESAAEIIHAKLDGGVESIGIRKFSAKKHPAWVMHWEDIVSPVMRVLNNMVHHAIEPTETGHKSFSELMAQRYPSHIYWIVGIFQMVSAAGCYFLCRRHSVEKQATITWTILGAVISLPAFVACMLMNPWRVEKTTA